MCADYEYCLLLLFITMYGELKYNELTKLQKLLKQLHSYVSSKHVCKFKQFTMVDSADESVHKLYQILGHK